MEETYQVTSALKHLSFGKQIAVLTDAGWDKVVRSAPGHAEAVQQLVFDRLTPTQVRQLARACESLLETPVEVVPKSRSTA